MLGKLSEEAERLELRRCLLIVSRNQQQTAQKVAAVLRNRISHIFLDAVRHTPVETTEIAVQVLGKQDADGIISVGGGSKIGLGKALSYRTGLPHIAVPTTYSGSEMTPILGETREKIKSTVRDPRIVPRVVIYDVGLTLTMSPQLTIASTMNAIAHSVEALYAKDNNPYYSLLAEESIRSMSCALDRLRTFPEDTEARWHALYGAWLGGICLGGVGMALHHKLCHVLGGAFDLPHAETHMIVLPHVVAYNASATPEAMVRMRRALDTDDPARKLHEMVASLARETGLRDIGMPEGGIAAVVDEVCRTPYWNPASMQAEKLRALLNDAWSGAPPVSSD